MDEGQDREDRQRPVVPSGGADDANDREDETEDVEDPADNVENRDVGQDARRRPEDEEVQALVDMPFDDRVVLRRHQRHQPEDPYIT